MLDSCIHDSDLLAEILNYSVLLGYLERQSRTGVQSNLVSVNLVPAKVRGDNSLVMA